MELVIEILHMKRLLLTAVGWCIILSSLGQGLLVNGNFEDRNVCIEFNSACAPEGWFRFPYLKMQSTNSARVAAGLHHESLVMEHRTQGVSGRTFLYTRLVCSTIPGRTYRFRIAVFTNGHAYDHIDLVLSKYEPQRNMSLILSGQADSYRLALTRPSPYVNDWREASVEFKATGEERFLLLGNIARQKIPFTRSYRYDDPLIIYDIDSISLLPAVGSWIPCKESEEQRKLLYLNNSRHTDFNYLDDEPAFQPDTTPALPPVVSPLVAPNPLPVHTADTLMIPDVLFRFDKGVLNPALYPRLQEIVAVIGQKKFRSLEVVGHTDNKGTSVYNQQLAEQRAKAVADYLIAQLKLSPQIITIRGMGSLLPVSSNTTPAGRQRNRRVEIILLY